MEELLNEIQLRENEIREIDARIFNLNERKTAMRNQVMALQVAVKVMERTHPQPLP